jgi:hypothetical protein
LSNKYYSNIIIGVKNKDTKFHRDKHNVSIWSGTAGGTGSTFSQQAASAVSAWGYPSGTAVGQIGRESGILIHLPTFSAAMYPSGSTVPTGYTHDFFINQAFTSRAHPMGIAPESISAWIASSAWIITGK